VTRRPPVAGVLALVLLAAGCGGSGADPDPDPAARRSTTSTTAAPQEGGHVVAEATGPTVEVFATRTATQPNRVLDRSAEASGRLVFLVTDDPGTDRLEALLPVRPNGSRGWLPRNQVVLSRNPFGVAVQLGAHRLVVTRDDQVVVEAPIGVGTGETPTPGGAYFIKELLRPPDPGGPYGPYAYGLSGFSTTLVDFAGGDGVIGLHGTDDPASIGTDVSHGCIRLDNGVITRLVEEVGLPLGTPVAITA
jgi:lipoprotein-anchoring transpeptidase ErfK/SrfK